MKLKQKLSSFSKLYKPFMIGIISVFFIFGKTPIYFAQEESHIVPIEFYTIRAMMFKEDIHEYREIAVLQKSGFVSFGEELIIIANEHHAEKQFIEIQTTAEDTTTQEWVYHCIKYDEECVIRLAKDHAYFSLIQGTKLFRYELCRDSDFLENWEEEQTEEENQPLQNNEENTPQETDAGIKLQEENTTPDE